MFDPTFSELDLGFLSDPYTTEDEGIAPNKTTTEQYEEGDKSCIGWLEATSDLQAFMNIGALPEVVCEDQEVTSVMEDVEKLLQSFDSAVDAAPAPAIDDSIPPDEMMAAEDLLDELLKSNDIEFDLQHFETSATTAAVENQQEEVVPNLESPETKMEFNLGDGANAIDMTNVTKVVTDDGKEIYVLIAPAPTSYSSDDSEWTPTTTSLKRRSVNQKARSSPYYIKDKKERKKHQNVKAAKKYREKQKDEQAKVDREEQLLSTKNSRLSAEVAELEAEVKTMKKLMTELGLL